ncbi:hypothetical protein BC827DRAFT_1223977 [Russula dissimulans]|nr:hypothetical protein BC827DRAFT_1223977 [Russula dissimulans]
MSILCAAHCGFPLRGNLFFLRRLWSWFLAVDTDRSGNISVHELQRALVNGDWTRKFSCVRSALSCSR